MAKSTNPKLTTGATVLAVATFLIAALMLGWVLVSLLILVLGGQLTQ